MSSPEMEGIESLADAGEFQEALNLCDGLLAKGARKIEVVRLRAYVHARKREYWISSELMEEVLRAYPHSLDDHYRGADYALNAGAWDVALRRLNRAAEISSRDQDGWYENAIQFYRAYVHSKLGRQVEARAILDSLKAAAPNIRMPLPNRGMASIHELEQDLSR